MSISLRSVAKPIGLVRSASVAFPSALRFVFAVGSDHDDRDVRSRRPRLGQQLKAAHPRRIDVREDQDESDRSPASLMCRSARGADWAKSVVDFGLMVEASFLAGPARGVTVTRGGSLRLPRHSKDTGAA
jgi:hypothetical protein